MSDPIKDALRPAARQFCICDGECYETRHGMMNGPCEQMTGQAAAAMAAFLRALPDDVIIKRERIGYTRSDFAGMIERAARDE